MTIDSVGATPCGSGDGVVRLLFRAVNDQIACLNNGQAFDREPADWICECADKNCFERIALTVAEFDAVRERPGCFAVKPGHAGPAEIVESHDGHLVVSTGSAPAISA